MQWNNYKQFILKEGYLNIAKALLIALGFLFLGFIFFAKLAFLAAIALLWIYRNNLSITNNPLNLDNTIYSPIDGKIAGIDHFDDTTKVYIDVSLLDNHILRAPIKSKMEINDFTNGINLSSWTFKSKFLNNKAILSFIDDSNEITKLTAISGVCATRVVLNSFLTNVHTRENIGIFIQGTIILELPKTYELKIKIGEKVSGGISVIAGKIESTIE
ncbi:MAG: phosphatidylserine decarboxylase [Arcobacteraceae bacterium]